MFNQARYFLARPFGLLAVADKFRLYLQPRGLPCTSIRLDVRPTPSRWTFPFTGLAADCLSEMSQQFTGFFIISRLIKPQDLRC